MQVFITAEADRGSLGMPGTGGVNVRRAAPEFVLTDQHGQWFDLGERIGSGQTLVVFYRGHWCPYCRRYLTKLQANLDRIRAMNAEVVAISPEPAETSKRLAVELGLGFRLLSDPLGEVIALYGVRNSLAGNKTLMPHPAVFIVDIEGRVTFRSIDRNYKKRTTVRTILHALAGGAGDDLPTAESRAAPLTAKSRCHRSTPRSVDA